MNISEMTKMLDNRVSQMDAYDREMNMGHSSDAYESSDDERRAARGAAKRADATATLVREALRAIEDRQQLIGETLDAEERAELCAQQSKAMYAFEGLVGNLGLEDGEADARLREWVDRMSRIEDEMPAAKN